MSQKGRDLSLVEVEGEVLDGLHLLPLPQRAAGERLAHGLDGDALGEGGVVFADGLLDLGAAAQLDAIVVLLPRPIGQGWREQQGVQQ